MPIYDQSFRSYKGPRQLQTLWWPVARYTVQPILKRKLVWVLLVFFLIFLCAISVGFVVSAKITQHVGDQNTHDAMRTARREGMPIFDSNVSLGTVLFVIMQPVKMLLWLLILIAGAGAISSDRRNNALPLYFSRPLKPWHYVAGKIIGIALLPVAILLLTQWILGIQFVAYYLSPMAMLKELPTFFSGALYALITGLFISTVMASASSMAKSARVAGLAFLCFFVLLEKITPMLARGSGNSTLLAISPLHSLDVIGRALLNPNFREFKSSVDTGTLSLAASVSAIMIYTFLFLVILRRNLRVVEVVK